MTDLPVAVVDVRAAAAPRPRRRRTRRGRGPRAGGSRACRRTRAARPGASTDRRARRGRRPPPHARADRDATSPPWSAPRQLARRGAGARRSRTRRPRPPRGRYRRAARARSSSSPPGRAAARPGRLGAARRGRRPRWRPVHTVRLTSRGAAVTSRASATARTRGSSSWRASSDERRPVRHRRGRRGSAGRVDGASRYTELDRCSGGFCRGMQGSLQRPMPRADLHSTAGSARGRQVLRRPSQVKQAAEPVSLDGAAPAACSSPSAVPWSAAGQRPTVASAMTNASPTLPAAERGTQRSQRDQSRDLGERAAGLRFRREYERVVPRPGPDLGHGTLVTRGHEAAPSSRATTLMGCVGARRSELKRMDGTLLGPPVAETEVRRKRRVPAVGQSRSRRRDRRHRDGHRRLRHPRAVLDALARRRRAADRARARHRCQDLPRAAGRHPPVVRPRAKSREPVAVPAGPARLRHGSR